MLSIILEIIYFTLVLIYFIITSVYFSIYLCKFQRLGHWTELLIEELLLLFGTGIFILYLMEKGSRISTFYYLLKITFVLIIMMGLVDICMNILKASITLFHFLKKQNVESDLNINRSSNIYIFMLFGLLLIFGILSYFILTAEDFTKYLNISKYFILTFTYIISSMFIFILNKCKIRLENYNNKGSHLYELIPNATLNLNNFEFLIYKFIVDLSFNSISLVTLFAATSENQEIICAIVSPLYIVNFIFRGNLLYKYDHAYGLLINRTLKKFFLTKFLFIDIISHNSKFNMPILPDSSENSILIVSGKDTPRKISLETINQENITHSVESIYLLFKILQHYYITNRVCINRFHRKIEHLQQDLDFNGKYNVNILITNIDRTSSITKTELINEININSQNLLINFEDKEIISVLLNKYFEMSSPNIKKPEKIDFAIKALFSELLLELLPFYQTYIDDIIESLDPQKNRATCQTLFEKMSIDKSYNNFFTFDYFLKFEIYDKSELSNTELKIFLESYHAYLKTRLKDWQPTYLPLIIGVFSINYANYNKIVILYRHPYAFSPFQLFKYWINVTHTFNQEKINISSNYTEIIDLKELEIKDNLALHRDDFKDVISILKSDFKFLRNIPIPLNYSINSFVIVDLNNFLSARNSSSHLSSLSEIENNIGNKSKSEKDKIMLNSDRNSKDLEPDYITAMRKTDLFRESLVKNLDKYKREHGSELLSSLDKVVTNYDMNNKYIIKLYFADICKISKNVIVPDYINSFNKDYSKK